MRMDDKVRIKDTRRFLFLENGRKPGRTWCPLFISSDLHCLRDWTEKNTKCLFMYLCVCLFFFCFFLHPKITHHRYSSHRWLRCMSLSAGYFQQFRSENTELESHLYDIQTRQYGFYLSFFDFNCSLVGCVEVWSICTFALRNFLCQCLSCIFVLRLLSL